MNFLKTIEINSYDAPISAETQQLAINALENGHVLYFPSLPFKLSAEELSFLSPDKVAPKSKNISYDLRTDLLGGSSCQGEEAKKLKEMVKRYALQSRKFMDLLFPKYIPYLQQARTSFRPVEALGRKMSYRKDDRLLHVDSFPANPVKGHRILRFFTNVNPNGKPRVWRLGEPFPDVVNKFATRAKKPFPGLASLLKAFKITKDYRTLYDHYMLQIHDTMKGDQMYQKNVPAQEILFPPGCTWIVYSDQVSHAAMSGQHLFEQTFHLPPEAMQNPERTPLKVLEKFFQTKLI